MLVGDKALNNDMKESSWSSLLEEAEILCLDEAHTMLKKADNKTFKTLQRIKTKRRILLTGTPLQNNVTEYYQMVNYAHEGVIGVKSEAEFNRKYR